MNIVVYAHTTNTSVHLDYILITKIKQGFNFSKSFNGLSYRLQSMNIIKQMKRFPLALITVQFREFIVGRHFNT